MTLFFFQSSEKDFESFFSQQSFLESEQIPKTTSSSVPSAPILTVALQICRSLGSGFESGLVQVDWKQIINTDQNHHQNDRAQSNMNYVTNVSKTTAKLSLFPCFVVTPAPAPAVLLLAACCKRSVVVIFFLCNCMQFFPGVTKVF